VQQPPQNTAHEQHRQENRHQRDGHGDNGEAYLFGALEGRITGTLPLFDMPDYVLQHNNGVIHHIAHCQGKGHHRDIVEGETKQLHHAEGADYGERQGQ